MNKATVWPRREQSTRRCHRGVRDLLVRKALRLTYFSGEETFDLSVEKPLWLMVSVRDRALVGKHDTVGRAYICLDPRRYGDFLTHDLWLDLDTQGRILLRISMEGEKDDLQFYFGRAFRSLKRAENDMVRVFIDKARLIYSQLPFRARLMFLHV